MKRSILFSLIAMLASSLCLMLACKSSPKQVAPTPRPPMAETITPGHVVSSGRSGECPLGWWQKDVNSSICSTGWGWTPAYSDAATIVFPINNLAPQDFEFVTVYVHAQVPNSIDFTGDAWWRLKWGVKYPIDAGPFADPTGAEAGTPVDNQIGSQLAGCAPTLVQQGNQLGVSMLCGLPGIAVEGAADLDRSALAPWVLSVSPAQAFAALGNTVSVAITTTPGGAQYVTGGTVDGYPLFNCSQTNDHVATCNLLAGTYTQTTGDVCITSQANPFCLRNGFSFDAGGPADSGADAADAADASDSGSDAGSAPAITSIVPNYALAGGSPTGAITVTGTGLLGGSPSVTFGGVAGTITSNTGTVATVTAPACTGAPLSCTAVNGVATKVTVTWTTSAGPGSSNGTFPNNFWFLPSTLDAVWSAQTVTNVGGNTHVILDESGNGYNATANGSNCPWTATGEGFGGSGQTPYITTTTCTGYTTSFPIQDAGTGEWFVAATHLGPDGGTGYDKLFQEGTGGQLLESQSTNQSLDEYNGSFANALPFGTPGPDGGIGNKCFASDSVFNGASSYQQCCSGLLKNGSNPGTTVSGAAVLTIGAASDFTHPWIGNFMFFAHQQVANGTSGGRTTMQAFFNDQGLNAW
jgi:hypothetical protein